MLVKIALGSIIRNLRRTLFCLATITFSMVVIVFIGSFLEGISRDWATSSINTYLGAMQIEHKDYEKEHKFKPLETTLTNGQELIERVEAYPKVTSAFGVLQISGIISNGTKSDTFFGRGIDIAGKYETLIDAELTISDGREIEPNKNEVVLGPLLAQNLEIEKIGDPVMLLVQTLKGGLNLVELEVVGLLDTEEAALSDYVSAHYVEVNLETAQKLMRMTDRISQIVVGYEDFDTILGNDELLEQELSQHSETPLVVKNYKELIPGYEVINFFDTISTVIGGFLFIIAGVGIANVMFMSVIERRKEIGTMKAIGMEQSQIRQIFLMEGTLIGAIGAVLGLIISIPLVFLIAETGGMSLPPPPGASDDITIYPYLNIESVIYGLILVLGISLVASYMPASISAKLDVVETLREE